MAKQTINIGTVANDGTGDTVRDAFDKVNDNFTELYTDDTGDVNSIIATAPIARDSATGVVTISLNDAGVTLAKMQNVAANSLLVRDANSSGVLTEKALATTQILIGDGTGMTAASLSGDVTMANTGAVTIAAQAVENSMIADNAVDHDELAVRYTDDVSITTLTGTVSFNCALGSVFKLSGDLTGAYTISLTGYKKGQIITIYPLKGSQTLNLAGAGSSTNTFNKLGGVNYDDDGSASNILQIECVDDSATDPVFFYSLATFAADASDI